MKEFDIISIGGGSGGIATMNRAAMYGAKAAVIEAGYLGGTCVNLGCVPKKIMWYGSQIAEAIQDYGPEYGFTSQEVTLDFSTLRKIVRPILNVHALPIETPLTITESKSSKALPIS